MFIQGSIPYKNFVLLDGDQKSALFNSIADHLMKTDIDYFYHYAVEHNKGFIMEVLMEPTEECVGSDIDFGSLPYLRYYHALTITQLHKISYVSSNHS